jgi:hypothetical protein
MTNQNREQDSINAYLKLMEKVGADSASLESRKQFLQRLVELIGGRPQGGGVYREAVDEALQEVDKAKWPYYLTVSREYYRFWIDDIKAIAAMHASGGYRAKPLISNVPNEELQVLWSNLDQEQFYVAEKWPLKAYAAALRQEGADQAVVETRAKLAKLLLVRLRDAPERDGNYYQLAVDSLMAVFTMKEMRELYIQVAREFFYFWISDPEAVGRIVLHQTTDD